MTIGAKYKTTVKDPGTTGILRMVGPVLVRRSSPSASSHPTHLISKELVLVWLGSVVRRR
jgi:hypothetical protein